MTEMQIEGVRVVEYDKRPPDVRGVEIPTTPLQPGEDAPNRQRIPVVKGAVPHGRLMRARTERDENLQRGGSWQSTVNHVTVDGKGATIRGSVYVPMTDAEADEAIAYAVETDRSIGRVGTVHLENNNHQLADENDNLHNAITGAVERVLALVPINRKWRERGGLGEIGRYRATEYDKLLDPLVELLIGAVGKNGRKLPGLYDHAAAHARRVAEHQAQRKLGGFAVMHDIIDRYPAMVERMLPLRPLVNQAKPRGHFHDLDTDRHTTGLDKLQDYVNEAEEIRQSLHTRDGLRNRTLDVGNLPPAFRGHPQRG